MIQHNHHTVCPIALFEDNYAWLIYNQTDAWIIDPGNAEPIANTVRELGVDLKGALITHSHWDHVNGIDALASLYATSKPLPVYGPANAHTGINHIINEGCVIDIEGLTLEVWHTPGHMAEHLSFYCREANWLFCGDTLFAAGCGRLKQTGNMQQLFNSLSRIKTLPAKTLIFCAHEYTQANLTFAQALEPNNAAIKEHINTVNHLRKNNQPSIPSTLATELTCNPFLRTHEQAIINATKNRATSEAPLAVFTALRQWKDSF